jgi:hypothetical protein
MALKEYIPGIGSGLTGHAPGSPITSLYGPPFEFTGTILSVTADTSGQLLHDRGGGESVRARRNGATVSDDESFASSIFVNQVQRNLVSEGVS